MQDPNAGPKDSAAVAAAAATEQSVTQEYWDKVKRAARENKPDMLRELMKEDVFLCFCRAEELGWTALHYAAFLGHTECVRILLNGKRWLMDVEAVDGSTALMLACANLPRSKQCIKVLCEHEANKYKYTRDNDSALTIALERKPDLEVVKWLVNGADMKKLLYNSFHERYLMQRLCGMELSYGVRFVKFPSDLVNDVETDENLRPEMSEVAEIAMYLADHGCVKGALLGLLWSSSETPQLEEVVECFLRNGAVMDELNDKENMEEALISPCSPRILSLFAKKSLIYLEGISTLSTSFMHESPYFEPFANALAFLLLRGQASGILPLTAVKEMQDKLKADYGEDLPPNLLPVVDTLNEMTKNPPSLCQLARTKIRAQMAKSGKFSRENLKKLELTKPMIDFVQLDDLGDGKEIEEILKSFDIFLEDEGDEEDENEEEEYEHNEEQLN